MKRLEDDLLPKTFFLPRGQKPSHCSNLQTPVCTKSRTLLPITPHGTNMTNLSLVFRSKHLPQAPLAPRLSASCSPKKMQDFRNPMQIVRSTDLCRRIVNSASLTRVASSLLIIGLGACIGVAGIPRGGISGRRTAGGHRMAATSPPGRPDRLLRPQTSANVAQSVHGLR